MKQCNKCRLTKPLVTFRVRSDTGKLRNTCRKCERSYGSKQEVKKEVDNEPPTGDTLVKRMLAGAKHRSKNKGLPFNLELDDMHIPAICPILKIPLYPAVEGFMTDNSPTLDRHLPHLGYVKGNVTVISNLANRIKTNANSLQIAAVLKYVIEIEEKL